MFLCCNDIFLTTSFRKNLKIYEISNKMTIVFDQFYSTTITCLETNNDSLFIGLFNGEFYVLNYATKFVEKIYQFHSKITCIFTSLNVCLIGTEDGDIVKMYIKPDNSIKSSMNEKSQNHKSTSLLSEPMNIQTNDNINITIINSGNLETDNDLLSSSCVLNTPVKPFEYFVLEKIKHSAPISSLVNDGDLIYILDIMGRIVVHPNKQSYDVYGSCLKFFKYLFVSEKNILYCKTKEAFACKFILDEQILEFKFSKTGNVVFIKTENSINVYDSNNEVISRFNIHDLNDILEYNNLNYDNTSGVVRRVNLKEYKFVFDENRNRFIFFDGKSINCLNDIIKDNGLLTKKMNKITFKQYNTEIKFKKPQYIENEINDPITVNRGHALNKNDGDNNFVNDPINNDPMEESFFHRKSQEFISSEENQELSSEDEEIKGDEYERKENFFKINEPNQHIEPFTPGSFLSNGCLMMCYNKIGYMINFQGYIEAVYHDRSISQRNFNGNYSLGVLSEKSILFSDSERVYLFGQQDWVKEINNVLLIYINERIVCVVTKTLLMFFSHCGLNLMNLLIKNPISICGDENNIVLFTSHSIMIFDANLESKSIPFNHPFSFCAVENDKIYFVNNEHLYLIKNSSFIQTIKVKDIPLCIFYEHLICCGKNLLPSPHIEYNKIFLNNPFSELFLNLKNEKTIEDFKMKTTANNRNILVEIFKLKENIRDKEEINEDNEVEKIETIQKEEKPDESFNSSNKENEDLNEIKMVKKIKRFNPFSKK